METLRWRGWTMSEPALRRALAAWTSHDRRGWIYAGARCREQRSEGEWHERQIQAVAKIRRRGLRPRLLPRLRARCNAVPWRRCRAWQAPGERLTCSPQAW